MKSTRALALSLAVVVSALSLAAHANQVSFLSRPDVHSCDVMTPGQLTKIEQAQIESKGYRLHKHRSEYVHERYLQTYEYYTIKNSFKHAGMLYLEAILSPSARVQNLFGIDPSAVSKREFRLSVNNGKYDSLLSLSTSTPPSLARTKLDLENADFSGLPNCRD
jgi:hypothetical protein